MADRHAACAAASRSWNARPPGAAMTLTPSPLIYYASRGLLPAKTHVSSISLPRRFAVIAWQSDLQEVLDNPGLALILRQPMRHNGLTLGLEAADRSLSDLVGIGNPVVLTKMLHPGVDEVGSTKRPGSAASS